MTNQTSVTPKDLTVKRIGDNLFNYLSNECCFESTGRMAIYEALYEMKDLTLGIEHKPTVSIIELETQR